MVSWDPWRPTHRLPLAWLCGWLAPLSPSLFAPFFSFPRVKHISLPDLFIGLLSPPQSYLYMKVLHKAILIVECNKVENSKVSYTIPFSNHVFFFIVPKYSTINIKFTLLIIFQGMVQWH